ncbi:hypothetical protein [Streptomyces sp. NPDC004296]
MAVLDRWWPSSKTCSNCGWQKPTPGAVRQDVLLHDLPTT